MSIPVVTLLWPTSDVPFSLAAPFVSLPAFSSEAHGASMWTSTPPTFQAHNAGQDHVIREALDARVPYAPSLEAAARPYLATPVWSFQVGCKELEVPSSS